MDSMDGMDSMDAMDTVDSADATAGWGGTGTAFRAEGTRTSNSYQTGVPRANPVAAPAGIRFP